MKCSRMTIVFALCAVLAIAPELFAAQSGKSSRNVAPSWSKGTNRNMGRGAAGVRRNSNRGRWRGYRSNARRGVNRQRNAMRQRSRNQERNRREMQSRKRERERKENERQKSSTKTRTVRITRPKPEVVLRSPVTSPTAKPGESENAASKVSKPTGKQPETLTKPPPSNPPEDLLGTLESKSSSSPWSKMSDSDLRRRKARELLKLGRVVDWQKHTLSELSKMIEDLEAKKP